MVERVRVVEGVRRGYRRPIGVVEPWLRRISRVRFDKFPVRIKIQHQPRFRMQIQRQKCQGTKHPKPASGDEQAAPVSTMEHFDYVRLNGYLTLPERLFYSHPPLGGSVSNNKP